jgi:hypothetical protein
MHEQPTGKSNQDLGTSYGRTGGYWLSAVHRKNRLGTITYLFGYDGGSWYYRADLSYQELNYSLAVIFTSAGGLGAGIGILIQQLFGGWW